MHNMCTMEPTNGSCEVEGDDGAVGDNNYVEVNDDRNTELKHNAILNDSQGVEV